MNTPSKIAVAVIGCGALAYNAELAFQLIVPLAVLYVVYRVVRSVILQQEAKKAGAGHAQPARPAAMPRANDAARPRPQNFEETTYHAPQGAASAAPAGSTGDWRAASQRHWKKRHGKRWREEATAALVVKAPRERVADLSGAMILAAVVGTIMSLVAVLLRGDTSIEKEQFAWLTLTSVAGAWAILIPAKLWEGTRGDEAVRRVSMLVVGLGVGAAAYACAQLLMVNFNDSPEMHSSVHLDFGANFYDASGVPQLAAYLAYFGALFVGIRWWRQADPLRRTRLSVWSVGLCVLAAWVVDWVWRFPQPWGVMVAAIMSTSVQLVSPHAASQERFERPAGKE
jgi:hypothetical protein